MHPISPSPFPCAALSAGILLLGYGLVEVPRHMWKSSPEQASKWCAHRAGRHAAAVMSETKELEAVVNVICANQRQMSRRDPLRPYMDVIAAFAEAESPVKPSAYLQRSSSTVEQLSAEDLEYNYDLRGLADLRRRLMRAVANYATATTQYRSAINEVRARSGFGGWGRLASVVRRQEAWLSGCESVCVSIGQGQRQWYSMVQATTLARHSADL